MVHPDFQKRGFGSVLTLHVNEISDKSGDRVWAPARPTSIHMFRQLGFKDIGVIDAHLERWGGSAEKSKTWIVRRDPSSAIL
jgi:ribosomal protein S18 acetylase RimI-like enzyme